VTHIQVRPEREADLPAIRTVNNEAFGGNSEARLVDALRSGGYARQSLVAEHEGSVIGHILFSALEIQTKDGIVPALALAPMAVLPGWQRQGIGSQLIRAGLDACRQQGHRIVIVLGHPEFYARFGFSTDLARPLLSPYAGPAWMALELQPGALKGVAGQVVYPPPFAALEE
jgi:putative acetyltransferase